jgi:hypothetical protein
MYIELEESGENTIEASLIILELIVKCDGLKCLLMSQLLKIYSVSPLRSASSRTWPGKTRGFSLTLLPRRENAADLYREAPNLHIPINTRVKDMGGCILTRGRGERTKRTHHEGCCRRCEVTFHARDKKLETKSMQTAALHASLTAHQTFIA